MSPEPTGCLQKQVDLKRKRGSHDDTDSIRREACHSKRPSLTRLPLRSPPTASHDRLWSNVAPKHHVPLTPVDSSDDEAHGQAGYPWSQIRATTPGGVQHWRNTRIPTVTVNAGADTEMDDMDMDNSDLILPKDLSAPPSKSMNLLTAPASFLDERVPTPITATFNIGNIQRSRCRRPCNITTLSPVMAEEPYLPSPTEPRGTSGGSDRATMMRTISGSDGVGALTAACKDEVMMENLEQSDGVYSPSHRREMGGHGGRNARLHMGFRADCDKCRQRVPGHYSHIIWS